MKILLLLLVITFIPITCFKDRIYYSYDDFEKKQKMMMEQSYSASKDFNKNQQVIINFYKEIDRNGESSISGKMRFHTNLTEGKLETKFLIKLNDEIYETNLYDIDAERIKHIQTKNEHLISYEKDESSDKKKKENTDKQKTSEIFTQTITENTYISNIAYFNLQKNIINEFLLDENLSFRFYLGKEGVTIYLSKNQIKAMKKFIQSEEM